MKPERKREGVARRGRLRAERIFDGLGVSQGIAIGPAHVVEAGFIDVPEYTIAEDAVAADLRPFAGPPARAQRQLKKLKDKSAALHGTAAEELGFLLDARMQMLSGSRVVRGVERRIAEERINAEAAVRAEITEVAQSFAELDDAYLPARAADIREVGDRLIRNLTRTPYQAFSRVPEDSIVIAADITPADTALMDPELIGGFATEVGGTESHTAIMARSLGLPAVLGLADFVAQVRTGDLVIVDGSAGRVVVRPKPATLAAYERRRGEVARAERQSGGLNRLPAVTRDGTAVTLLANLELPREAEAAVAAGAEGVGLLRTEFLFMNRPDLPDEEEQYQALRAILKAMDGRSVTVRTLDVGGDKLAASLDVQPGGANPALGLRAIRLSLKMTELLETQLAAILRAGAQGPVRILLPMVSTVSEARQVREILAGVVRRLKRRNVRIADPLPPLGVMIEIPGAALAADALAQVA